MHEQTIAQDIIKQATKQGTVKSITVVVGDLAHIPIEELGPVLHQMNPWRIKMVPKRAMIKCECGYIGPPNIKEKGHDHTIYECPKCKAPMPKILDGGKIILKEVEVE